MFAMLRMLLWALWGAAILLSPSCCFSESNVSEMKPAACIAPRTFSWEALAEPENLFWPAYFWSWNGPLEPDVLRRELADMAAHDARSVCAMPMPHEFRPDIMNNRMDVDYLSPDFFERVKVAVNEAARLKMNYWLYDEGGWPSGQAAGRVLRENPDAAVQVLTRDQEGKWNPQREGRVDLLNPQTTETFIKLTHDRYANAVGEHFGKTIKLMFSDEPAFRHADLGKLVPWPREAASIFQQRFGYDVLPKLDAFNVTKVQDLTQEQSQIRVDLFDFWSKQFCDAYFSPLRDWGRRHDLASSGHLGGEDETINAIRHGFGHVMRPLRAFDVPGVDAIWRQVFPSKETNHHFPKFASSAMHQNGSALAFTESFCVYGNGITPAQMKWIVDYQYVRGLTLLVCGLYPLSTQDHLMTHERPHFGPTNPCWDLLPDFHRYVARLGYVMACGQPDIEVGLYYPVRDLWASGNPADPAAIGHDAIAKALLQRQCDFDIVDDDVLGSPTTHIESERLAIGPMRYRTIVVGPTHWMTDAAQHQLEAFQAVGGQVVRVDDIQKIGAALASIAPTVQCDPPTSGLRVTERKWSHGGAVFLFNEGGEAYHGTIVVDLEGPLQEIQPATGLAESVEVASSSNGRQTIAVDLAAGESKLLLAQAPENAAKPRPSAVHKIGETVDLADGWTARVDRHYVAGEHDYEIQPSPSPEFKPTALGRWATTLGLGEDFSGHVVYRRTVQIPESARGRRLFLDLPNVEYAAQVSVDGKKVGCVLWSPWRIELPAMTDRTEFVLEITVANTLANELTSARVRDAWAQRKGPGWPSCYHQRALDFEKESRGGGLVGPVQLRIATP
jgi:hypothetical protein